MINDNEIAITAEPTGKLDRAAVRRVNWWTSSVVDIDTGVSPLKVLRNMLGGRGPREAGAIDGKWWWGWTIGQAGVGWRDTGSCFLISSARPTARPDIFSSYEKNLASTYADDDGLARPKQPLPRRAIPRL